MHSSSCTQVAWIVQNTMDLPSLSMLRWARVVKEVALDCGHYCDKSLLNAHTQLFGHQNLVLMALPPVPLEKTVESASRGLRYDRSRIGHFNIT
jgi:hypothetical protein